MTARSYLTHRSSRLRCSRIRQAGLVGRVLLGGGTVVVVGGLPGLVVVGTPGAVAVVGAPAERGRCGTPTMAAGGRLAGGTPVVGVMFGELLGVGVLIVDELAVGGDVGGSAPGPGRFPSRGTIVRSTAIPAPATVAAVRATACRGWARTQTKGTVSGARMAATRRSLRPPSSGRGLNAVFSAWSCASIRRRLRMVAQSAAEPMINASVEITSRAMSRNNGTRQVYAGWFVCEMRLTRLA